MTRPRLVLVALLSALPCAAVCAAPRVLAATPSAASVGRFARFTLDLQVDGAWQNPFDPAQADVRAEFIGPGGRVSRVPAFYTREFARTITVPQDARRHVDMVKLYAEEKGWHGAAGVEFYVDDLALVNTRTGARTTLDDMETGDARRWGGDGVSWSTDEVHGGRRSLRFAPTIDAVEHWPGPVTVPRVTDWSRFDGMEVWVYPRYSGTPGTLSVYFHDTQGGNSPILTLDVGRGALLPNRWNRIAWSWRDFPPSVRFRPVGKPHWQVRFTPSAVGRYRYRITARDTTGTASGPAGSFVCRPSASPGFVRISRKDPRYFVRDDGKPFFPIGHDVAWDLRWAAQAFPRMRAHGENATYCILIPWENCIEWSELGRYDLERAARIDALLDLAAANGIYLKLSFDVHDALRRGAQWEQNPYSAARGGPCKGPNEFYTDQHARDLYKRRLRYMVARWGYSPHVMAWETVAEIDGAAEMPDGTASWGYPGRPGGDGVSAMLAAWLRDVHATLRAEDPYGRLLTVCMGGDVSDPRLWMLPEVQYVQLHHYDSLDPGGTMPEWCARLSRFGKPVMITEFGWWADWTRPVHDPRGICQHNGIWASSLGGAAASAFSWWWERIDSQNLYPHYRALRRFVDGVAWPDERFRRAQATALTPGQGRYLPVTLVPRAPFEGGSTSRFAVDRAGTVSDPGQLPQFLLSPTRRKGPATSFVLNCPVPGEFRVRVDSVSPDARLDISVDGRPALSQELPARDVPGKASTFDEKWGIWRCRYDQDFAVPVPAGRCVVEVQNGKPNGSWILVTSYTLTRYAPPSLRVVGLTGRRTTLLWVQNAESTWWNEQQDRAPEPIRGAQVRVAGLAPGRYAVEWWDTYAGRVTARHTVRAVGGAVSLRLRPVARDVACKLRRIGDAGRAR